MPIVTAIIAFFFLLWSVHKDMVSKRAERWQELSQQFESINQLVHDISDRRIDAEPEETTTTIKKIELMQQNYQNQRNIQYPTWPFNLGIIAKLITVSDKP